MRTLMLSPLLVAAALAGCATAPDTPSATAGKADGKQAAVGSFTDTTPLTGSRFARSTTDRNVRVIGNDAAREDATEVRSIGNLVGARSN